MSRNPDLTYGDYLALDVLLDAQHPLSRSHDEMLFIIQHQTTELWMRLIVHELAAAREMMGDEVAAPVFKTLTRVARVFETMMNAWDVLRTLTPIDFTAFREDLARSSGFQSHQYRMIEFMLGERDPAMLRPHAARPDRVAALKAELARPSLYHVALRRLEAALGRRFDESVFALETPPAANPEVTAAWAEVYRAPEAHWPLYELAEKLVDLEDYFRRWRFNHVTTVERVIGAKPGTGGTAGASYLRKRLDVELFPDLWAVRAAL